MQIAQGEGWRRAGEVGVGVRRGDSWECGSVGEGGARPQADISWG